MKKVFIIVLNFNGKKDTLECLQSLKKSEVIVVDNGSTDGSVRAIRDKFPEIKILENKKNLGFAKGNNVGIRYALNQGADYIILLNNDTIVEINTLVRLIEVASSNNRIGILGPKIYFAKGFEFHQGRYKKNELGKVIWYAGGLIDWRNVLGVHRGVDEVDEGQYDKQEEVEFVSGCCMFIKREVFKKIGLLDERFFLYFEDLDFCLRAKKVGFRIVYVPEAVIWHKNAATVGGSGSDRQRYHYRRSRLIFGLRFAPIKTKLALIRESIKLLLKRRF